MHKIHAFDNRVTLTSDILTSSLAIDYICVSNLVLLARVVFLLERGQTRTDIVLHTKSQMLPAVYPTHALATSGMGN